MLQDFAKLVPDLISKYFAENKFDQCQMSMVRRLFLGLHEPFQIFLGERTLLLRVSNWVKTKVSRESMNDDFSLFSESNYGVKQSMTTHTIVGDLFSSKGTEGF